MALTTETKNKLKPIVYVPDDPENLHISKEQFVEKRRKQKEKDAKLRAYAEKIDDEQEEKKEAPKTETHKEETPKKSGRPKKTE